MAGPEASFNSIRSDPETSYIIINERGRPCAPTCVPYKMACALQLDTNRDPCYNSAEGLQIYDKFCHGSSAGSSPSQFLSYGFNTFNTTIIQII